MGVEAHLFASWNPHFTPEWLCEQMAGRLALTEGDVIFDPACGSGNLLISVHRTASREGNSVRLVGVDSSQKAVRECTKALSLIGASARARIVKSDFMKLNRASFRIPRPLSVVMNPPYGGYGTLSRTKREDLSRLTSLSGRFNLAHAFVVHAIQAFRPARVVALLPSNWANSSSSHFRTWLDSSGGTWEWESTPGNPFPGIGTKVGILDWTAGEGSVDRVVPSDECARSFPFEVRSGVATGCDAAFIELAEVSSLRGGGGRVAFAVRGREVGRAATERIWVPPTDKRRLDTLFKEVPRPLRQLLSERSCVFSRGKHSLEYHDRLPSWFLGEPKVIVPEIATGDSLRVSADPEGHLLPLHSTISIRAGSKNKVRELARFLRTREVSVELQRSGAQLNGRSYRLSVTSVRRLCMPTLG